jgi:hypothetical protein
MSDLLTKSLGEFTVGWLLVSVGFGGLLGGLAKYLFEFHLPESLKARQQSAIQVRKYSYPLLQSADAVEHRLETLLTRAIDEKWFATEIVARVRKGGGFLADPVKEQGYFFLSTLYVFARYFAWLEILRQEAVYLNYSRSKNMRVFNKNLIRINNTFRYTDIWDLDEEERAPVRDSTKLYRHLQAALGESMIVERNGQLQCRSFREFALTYTNPAAAENRYWLRSLEDYFEGLGEKPSSQDFRIYRLVLLQYSFYKLIRFLDPKEARVQARPRDHEERILARLPKAQKEAVHRLLDDGAESPTPLFAE